MSRKTPSLALLSTLTFLCTSYASAETKADRQWPLHMIEVAKEFKAPGSSKPVIIAVIDTGIDRQHAFLNSMLWINAGETGTDSFGRDKATNGVDDDGNGFVDDVHGWNFVGANADVNDSHGHGTHVAGIIASVSGAEFPPQEGAQGIKLMVLKYYGSDSSPLSTMKNTVAAIDYAVKNGAHIINYSGGGLSPNAEEKAALEKASQAGVLLVAAAGNEASNSDYAAYYPANYALNNILSVGGVDKNKNLVASSNYGFKNVDIMAPGEDIPSSLPLQKFGLMTGTSQATAFASAVAALLLKERNFNMKPQELIRHLIETGSYTPSLENKNVSASIINAKRSLRMSYTGELLHGRVENYRAATETSIMSLSDSPLSSGPDLDWTRTLLQSLL